jgi:hypothetical protein
MAEKEQKASVYVGWTTFKNCVMDALAKSMPNVIDKSVFSGQAGGVQSQLMAAVKFLDLIDEKGTPKKALEDLAVSDGPARKQVLARILKTRYAAVFAVGLDKATPKQLSDAMATAYGVGGDTLEKSVRFFLAAAKYAEIPVSPHLQKNVTTALRRRPNGSRKPRSEATPPILPTISTVPTGGASRTIALASGGNVSVTVSVDVFSLTENDRKFVFGLIDTLTNYEKANPPDDDAVEVDDDEAEAEAAEKQRSAHDQEGVTPRPRRT